MACRDITQQHFQDTGQKPGGYYTTHGTFVRVEEGGVYSKVSNVKSAGVH